MSKQLRRVTSSTLPPDQRSYQPWTKDARPDVEIHRELLRQLAESRFAAVPREIASYLNSVARSCVNVYWPKGDRRRSTLNRKEIGRMVRRAVHEGYLAALVDYASDIQHSNDPSVLNHKQEQGGKRGRDSQATAKRKRASHVEAMLKAGHDVPEIAKQLGCSIATVYRALSISSVPQDKQPPRRPKR